MFAVSSPLLAPPMHADDVARIHRPFAKAWGLLSCAHRAICIVNCAL
jgi:hypothetical protein